MRARRVPGLDPAGPVRENAARVVRVRLDELCALAPKALDGRKAKALHDMRIAAKRLRYVLELTAFCFGPYAAQAARSAHELQDLIGAIHDCDVLEPRVRAHIAALRDADVEALVAAQGRPHAAHDGDGELPRLPAPRRAPYGALEALLIDQRARRAILVEQLSRRWSALERRGFRAKLLAALEEVPAAERPAHGARAGARPAAAERPRQHAEQRTRPAPERAGPGTGERA